MYLEQGESLPVETSQWCPFASGEICVPQRGRQSSVSSKPCLSLQEQPPVAPYLYPVSRPTGFTFHCSDFFTSLHLCSTVSSLRPGTKFYPSIFIPSTLHVLRIYYDQVNVRRLMDELMKQLLTTISVISLLGRPWVCSLGLRPFAGILSKG